MPRLFPARIARKGSDSPLATPDAPAWDVADADWQTPGKSVGRGIAACPVDLICPFVGQDRGRTVAKLHHWICDSPPVVCCALQSTA